MFFWLPILIETENLIVDIQGVREWFLNHGIETRMRYSQPLQHQPAYIDYMSSRYPEYKIPITPEAEYVAARLIGLPARADMTQEEIDYIIMTVHKMEEELGK